MRIAIVGCGQIADAHIREARRIPGVEVAAVCDVDRHMADQAACRFGVPGYTDVRTVLREARPDVVHVTTPPASHLPIARAALEYGAHVYVEKPLTVTLAEAEELADVAARTGRLVCVGHSCAFDESFQRLLEASGRGRLGDVVHVDALMGYDLDGAFGSVFMTDPTHWIHRLPGGVAQNNLSHPLSMVLEFVRDARPRIEATGFRWRPHQYGDVRDDFFDEVRVTLTGETTTASVIFSCRVRPVQLRATVYGSRCQADVCYDARTLRLTSGSTLPGALRKADWARRDAGEAWRECRRHVSNLIRSRLHYFHGLHELFRRFFLAVEGKGPMPIPLSEAVRMTALMAEIVRRCRGNAA